MLFLHHYKTTHSKTSFSGTACYSTFRRLSLLIVFGGSFGFASAQDTVLNIPYNRKLDSLHSGILKQERLIEVFTPSGYKPGGTEKYDVLYDLDGGNWNTGLISRSQRFIEDEGFMPPTIIVSVMGIDRNLDLTPTHLDTWQAASGGGANFLAFIKTELIPYINTHYPSNGDNTLWGHSLGGLFVLYAMLNEPTSFKSYIAVDPSVWWDHNWVARQAAGKLSALANQPTTLFIGGREGEALHGMGIDTFETVLKNNAPKNLVWKLHVYPDETHSSVRFKTTYDGLKFTYAGFTQKIEFAPNNGMVLKDRPYKIWYFEDTARTYYTLDGTTPTKSSAIVSHEITLSDSATVTFKRVANRAGYDKTVTGSFTLGKMPPPVPKPKKAIPGGFRYSYYEGDWFEWPDLKKIKPLKTGLFNKNLGDSLQRKNRYALVTDGWLEIKEEGYYVFFTQADKGSKLFLADKLLMEWEDYKPIHSYLVPLSKGFYPLRMEYLERKADYKLLLFWVTPAIMETKDPVPIPADVQYSVPGN